MADKNTIKDLLAEEIKNLYSAEKQLIKAIPKMARCASDPALREAFTNHLAETRQQVKRIEQVAEILGVRAPGKKCVGIEGCIKEGGDALQQDGEADVLDLGLISAGSRVEHYEIAGYLTAISLARQVGADEAVKLLNESLQEEQNAERTLRKIAAGLLESAPKSPESAV